MHTGYTSIFEKVGSFNEEEKEKNKKIKEKEYL